MLGSRRIVFFSSALSKKGMYLCQMPPMAKQSRACQVLKHSQHKCMELHTTVATNEFFTKIRTLLHTLPQQLCQYQHPCHIHRSFQVARTDRQLHGAC